MSPRRRSSMQKLADEAAKKTDEELSDQELQLLLSTTVDLSSLRPQVTDQATFDKLVEEVQKSTAANESLAALKSRIQSLGDSGLALAKKVVAQL